MKKTNNDQPVSEQFLRGKFYARLCHPGAIAWHLILFCDEHHAGNRISDGMEGDAICFPNGLLDVGWYWHAILQISRLNYLYYS
jgi:hypothetical protein